MVESTHREALIAEMLGDLGKMHDLIQTLRDDGIPRLVQGVKQATVEPVAEIAAAARQADNAARHIETAAHEALRQYVSATEGARRELDAAAKNAAATSQEAINMAVAQLVPTVAAAVSEAARQKVREIDSAEHAIAIWWGCLTLGVVFCFGVLYGSRVLAGLQTGQIPVASVLSYRAVGTIVAGLVAPVLIGLGLHVRRENTSSGWVMIGLGIAPIIAMLLALLGVV